MRDDTTTDDEDAPTTEHTTGRSSRLADAGRIQLSRPRELGRYLDEERYPPEVYPTLNSEPELWVRAVEDLRIDDVFAENYTHDNRTRVVVADREGVDGTHRGPEAVVSEALERLAPLAACVARHHPDGWGGAPPGGVDIRGWGAPD